MMKFPWSYTLLNGAILLAVLVVLGVLSAVSRVWDAPSQSVEYFISVATFYVALGVMLAFFLFMYSLVYQAIVYFTFRRRIRSKAIWRSIFLLPAMLFAGFLLVMICLQIFVPTNGVDRILASGRLAQLPEDAHGIEYASWSGIFTGEQFLRFQASSEEINGFILNSPSLSAVQPKIYSKDYVRIPYPENYGDVPEHYDDEKHDYYFLRITDPDWFFRELRDRGRVYEIPSEDHHNWGLLIVDDVKDIVYITVIWS